jgi:hypothetical protein
MADIRPAARSADGFVRKNPNSFRSEKPEKYLYAGEEFFDFKKKNYFDEIGANDEFCEKVGCKKEGGTAGRIFFASPENFIRLMRNRIGFSFTLLSFLVFFFIFGAGFLGRGWKTKNSVTQAGQSALASLASAQSEILSRDFQKSTASFEQAEKDFGEISSELDELGGILVGASRYVPLLSRLSSGARLAEAGQNISRIGILAAETAAYLGQVKKPVQAGEKPFSLLELFQDTQENAREILVLLEDTDKEISGINIDDIPEDQREKFLQLKGALPDAKNYLQKYAENSRVWTDVLGGNGPRKYLFLFQNNQEMRATGGFIGTYGLLDIFNGHVRNFFIDGIFNPDGQLTYKVVPPVPIQKISAAWSMHDSNWFPDFPVSAEKAIWFFEKTGGPTADGVIALTPTVMQKLLAAVGPIEMPEYGVTVDSDNFLEKIQYEVEYDYDKELNQPKKILSDLAPKVMERILNLEKAADAARVAEIILASFAEKQIMLYSKNYEIEKLISGLGWSGEILETQNDYLSVINTNINGYKTDGVIEEKIEHTAEIQADGSIVDSVAITRHHNGGQTAFDWWNKVNTDYLRVYVPQGSVLLSAEGQTREFNAPPLDYDALRFKRDPQVQKEEDSTRVDEESGTRIYEDAGKTVFANWVYVSPQETVTVRYKYLLPFKFDLASGKSPVETYSLLAQKQAGSFGSQFDSKIIFPDDYKIKWKYPEIIDTAGNDLELKTDLKTDKFVGAALTQE